MKSTCLVLITAFSVLLLSCHDNLLNGDLVFQVNDGSEFTDAIETSTSRDGLIFSHVGIVSITDTGIYIIEANTKYGVVATPLQTFLNESAHSREGSPIVDFYRVNTSQSIANDAVRRATMFIGRPYDFAFGQGCDKIYCSELVYECFLDKDGSHIFHSKPMNFRDTDGQLPLYWTEHFSKLGVPIPEHEEGTNPNDMAKSDKVRLLDIKVGKKR